MTPLILSHAELELRALPELGGGIAGFTWRGLDVFRTINPTLAAVGDPRGLSSFPLVPFAGRVTDGRFDFDGREIRLAANMPPEPHAIHGHGWKAGWRVVERAADSATLDFRHAAADWPWTYEARQTLRLEADALVHGLRVRNLGPGPMPAGLGLHPYFPARPWLTARASGVLTALAEPGAAPAPLPPAWDWPAGRVVVPFIDNPFTGWDGIARLTWPERDLAVTLTSDPPLQDLVIYAPETEAYVCVEPLTHRVGALNLSPGGLHHGMVQLEEGESLSLSVRFAVGRV